MPGPLLYAVSGITDANGNASLRLDPQLVPREWASVQVVVQVAGAPTTTITSGGVQVAAGGGPNPTMGVLLPPSPGPVTLAILKAQAGAQVSVTVQGYSDPDPNTAQSLGGGGGGGGAPSNIGAQIIDAPLDIDVPAFTAPIGTNVYVWGPFDCTTWQSFCLNLSGAAFLLTTIAFEWFTDETQTLSVAQRVFNYDGTDGQPFAGIIPNLGPSLVIATNGVGGGTGPIAGFRTQRSPHPSFYSTVALNIEFPTTAIGSGNTHQFGGGLVPGPWGYRWSSSSQPATLTIAALGGSGNFRAIRTDTIVAAGGGTIDDVIDLPDAVTQWTLTNTGGGSSNFTLFAYPITTGSR